MHGLTRRHATAVIAGALGASAASAFTRAAAADEALKIGVIYVSPISDIGWTKQHNDAAMAIKAALGDRVELTVVDSLWEPQAIDRVLADMVANGAKLIFATSFSHSTPVQKAARKFPQVIFEHLLRPQARGQPRDLRSQVLRGNLRGGRGRGPGDPGRQDRLRRGLPDPRHRRAGQCAAARRPQRATRRHLPGHLPEQPGSTPARRRPRRRP